MIINIVCVQFSEWTTEGPTWCASHGMHMSVIILVKYITHTHWSLFTFSSIFMAMTMRGELAIFILCQARTLDDWDNIWAMGGLYQLGSVRAIFLLIYYGSIEHNLILIVEISSCDDFSDCSRRLRYASPLYRSAYVQLLRLDIMNK